MKNLHSKIVYGVCVLHNIINNIFDVSYDMRIKFMRTYLYVNLYDISTSYSCMYIVCAKTY